MFFFFFFLNTSKSTDFGVSVEVLVKLSRMLALRKTTPSPVSSGIPLLVPSVQVSSLADYPPAPVAGRGGTVYNQVCA